MLSEFLKSIEYGDVWRILRRYYGLDEEAEQPYGDVFRELLMVTPNAEGADFVLIGLEVEDAFEPGVFTFEISAYSASDGGCYGIDMMDWAIIAAMDVYKKSVEVYGVATFFAHLLYEITFYGVTYGEVHAQQQELYARLRESEPAGIVATDDSYEEQSLMYEGNTEEKDAEEKAAQEVKRRNSEKLAEFLTDLPRQLGRAVAVEDTARFGQWK